jgi:glycosyltransferase 2 family protein
MSSPPNLRRALRRVLVVVFVGVAVYGGFVVASGYQAIAQSLSTFVWSTLALALALSSTNYAIRFLKWQYYLKVLGINGVKPADSALVFLSGFVLTVTPGKVGEVFKSAVLHETHGVAPERTAPIVIAERLTDVIGVVVLILFGSASFDGGLVWAIAGLGCVLLGLGCIYWQAPVLWVFARMSRGLFARVVPKLETAWSQLRRLSSLQTLVIPSLLSIVAWGLEGIGLYVLLVGFGQTVSLPLACFFYATATLAGALTPLPGGLGVTEALMQQQLVRVAGVASGAATSSMLLIRIATLWWAVVVGFAALGLLKLRYPHLLSETTGAAPQK